MTLERETVDAYVKPDASLDEKPAAKTDMKVTKTVENKILALPHINKFTVRRVLHSGTDYAEKVLKDLVAAGKLKTFDERYVELYPPPAIEEG